MADNEVPECAAEAEGKESLFAFRVVGVGNQERVLIEKDRLSLFKRNAVLVLVLRVSSVIPRKPQFRHLDKCNYIVVQ